MEKGRDRERKKRKNGKEETEVASSEEGWTEREQGEERRFETSLLWQKEGDWRWAKFVY